LPSHKVGCWGRVLGVSPAPCPSTLFASPAPLPSTLFYYETGCWRQGAGELTQGAGDRVLGGVQHPVSSTLFGLQHPTSAPKDTVYIYTRIFSNFIPNRPQNNPGRTRSERSSEVHCDGRVRASSSFQVNCPALASSADSTFR